MTWWAVYRISIICCLCSHYLLYLVRMVYRHMELSAPQPKSRPHVIAKVVYHTSGATYMIHWVCKENSIFFFFLKKRGGVGCNKLHRSTQLM